MLRHKGAQPLLEHQRIRLQCSGLRCQLIVVKNCRTAIEAAEFVRGVTEPGAVVLVNGSQNTIYLEEAVKLLIENSEDVQLVRQSDSWRSTKEKYFAQFY